MACVDLVDDLQVSGQDSLKHGHRPSLQSLREQRVVGVGKRLGADAPCSIPAQILCVHQNVHELRDGQSWVGVIQLDGNLEVSVPFTSQFIQTNHFHKLTIYRWQR